MMTREEAEEFHQWETENLRWRWIHPDRPQEWNPRIPGGMGAQQGWYECEARIKGEWVTIEKVTDKVIMPLTRKPTDIWRTETE